MESFYSVKDFAKILSVHPNTVRKMIHEGRLHPINTGSDKKPTYKIPSDDLVRLMAESFPKQDEE